MKKIVCLLLALCALFPFMVLPTFAEENQKDILWELSGLKIGNEVFDEKNYPLKTTDSDLHILTVAERNFYNSVYSPNYAFDLYFYNPGALTVQDSLLNRINVAFSSQSEDFNFYSVKLVSHSEDWRFVKFTVWESSATPGRLLKNFYNSQKYSGRIYNIVNIQVVIDEKLKNFDVAKTYVFSGSESDGTLTCREDELKTIDCELHSSVWRSEYNLSDEYTFNQIASVYFTLPKTLIEEYGELYALRSQFDKYRSSPIIVTNLAEINQNTDLVYALEHGTATSSALYYGMMDTSTGFISSTTYKWAWGIEEKDDFFYKVCVQNKCNAIGYYFYNPSLSFTKVPDSPRLYSAVSSKEFQKYIQDHSGGSLTEVNPLLYEGGKEVITIDHTIKDKYFVEASKYEKANWFLRFFGGKYYVKTETGAKSIPVLQVYDPSELLNGISADSLEKMYINGNDLVEFTAVCSEAKLKNEVVVCYRFDQSDYEVHQVDSRPKIEQDSQHAIWMAQQTFYYNVSLISATFHKEGEYRTVPFNSNAINVVGGVDVTAPRPKFDWGKLWEMLKRILLIILVVVLIVLLFPVLMPLLSVLWNLLMRVITFPIKLFQKILEKRKKNE